MCLKGRHSKKVPVGDFWVCARYAPGGFLAGILIPAFNDLGLIHGDMRRRYAPAHTGSIVSQYDCRNDWGMRRICAGHKLGIPENSRRQNDVRKTTWSSTGLVFPSKECFTKFWLASLHQKSDMRRGMRPIYIYARTEFYAGYAPAYAPYIYIYIRQETILRHKIGRYTKLQEPRFWR